MNFIDYIIIAVLIIAALVGFKKGVLNSVVIFVGTLVVIILAFYLKNPISVLLYQYLPFFNLPGKFAGVNVFNILIYEAISFFLTVVVLAMILSVIAKITGVVEKFLRATIVLGIPSKILGAIFGLLEGYILAFVIVFILSLTAITKVNESKYSSVLLESTPILSSVVGDTYNSVSEVYKICADYQDETDKDEANRKSLDVLLKYEILGVKSADKLIETKKLKTPGIKEIVDKYRN